MNGNTLDRRRMLAGGLTLASVCARSGRAVAAPAAAIDDTADFITIEMVDDEEIFRLDFAEQRALLHAPFRAEFLAWLGESSGRFALPVSAHPGSPSYTELRVPDMHPALKICLQGEHEINVAATWNEVSWDIVASMNVYANEAPNGTGWRNTLLNPQAQRIHPTQETCWREDGFEELLNWFNRELAPATHLALYGGDDCDQENDWTSADLARDGILLRTGKPLSTNSLRHLLPLQAMRA